jgi:hypothetical protein
MARRRKAPVSIEKAVSNFRSGVEGAKDKWATRTLEGATMYEVWFKRFAKEVYPLLETLPAPVPGDHKTNWLNRGAPIVDKLKKLSEAFYEAKLKAVAEAAKKVEATLPMLA